MFSKESLGDQKTVEFFDLVASCEVCYEVFSGNLRFCVHKEVNKKYICTCIYLYTWNLQHLFTNGWFNWMISILYLGDGWESLNIHLKLVGFWVPGMYSSQDCSTFSDPATYISWAWH